MSAKEVCGEVICKDRKYRTPWWTEEVKEAVKERNCIINNIWLKQNRKDPIGI